MLRGAAAAVVKNMSASLEVPTATSVRAIPAKLMIDNRIVINNHLKRTRGGKISFTHLLGYAIVQAVKKFPNMNRHFAEIDGKPNVVTPAHTNLGLAIDLPGKDGNRNLVVAAIKRCETMRFGQFIAAYEDIVRRARDGKLTAEDFAGVTISLTNPGTIGTVHSVPRLMRGQGAIVGAGATGVPGRVPGRQRGTHLRAGRRQADHADVDLRPPHHPGRGVRRLPAHHPSSCCCPTTSSTRSSASWASRTSRFAGAPTIPTRSSTRTRG